MSIFEIVFIVIAVVAVVAAGVWSWKSDNSGKKKLEELNKESEKNN